MREIKHIVLHCTATSQKATVESILKYWKETLGWKAPGYHWLITPDGKLHHLLDIEKVANGVKGYNSNSIHISYIGGVDAKGKAIDNRTPAQIKQQVALLRTYKAQFPNAEIKGHRDFLKRGKPGWKECPSFDVATWLKDIGFNK